MSENNHAAEVVDKSSGDGVADAIAATAVMTIVIVTVCYWLSGFAS